MRRNFQRASEIFISMRRIAFTIATIVVRIRRHGSLAGFNVQRVPQEQLDLFSRNLKRLRTKAGLSQEELAERAEITARYLQSIEAADFGASLAVLIRLRRALRCSWNRLLDGIE
jgi:DNA-binding XRE family transcriptional regulator